MPIRLVWTKHAFSWKKCSVRYDLDYHPPSRNSQAHTTHAPGATAPRTHTTPSRATPPIKTKH